MLIVNDDLVFKIQKYLFFLIPISFIIGQTAVAIIFFSIILSLIFCLKKIVVIFKKYKNYDIVLLLFFIYYRFFPFLNGKLNWIRLLIGIKFHQLET
jgi:hypothetical protein